jgi:hypothetical protein
MKHPLSGCRRFPLSTFGGGGRSARDDTIAAGRPLLGVPALGYASFTGNG